MNFRAEPAIVGFWVRRQLRLEAMLYRLMPKLPLNVAPWSTSGNCAKCRRSVALGGLILLRRVLEANTNLCAKYPPRQMIQSQGYFSLIIIIHKPPFTRLFLMNRPAEPPDIASPRRSAIQPSEKKRKRQAMSEMAGIDHRGGLVHPRPPAPLSGKFPPWSRARAHLIIQLAATFHSIDRFEHSY